MKRKFYLIFFSFIAPVILTAQSHLYNAGGDGLTFYIAENLTVHVDGDVTNAASATMTFTGSGIPEMQFDGDFTNSTSGVLNCGASLLALTGSASQNLDFGGDVLYRLSINNTAGGVFTRAATVNNDVTFTAGDFTTTNTNLLTFGTAASATSASNTSHVVGPVAKNFTSTAEFDFPVGDGTSYNYAGIIPQSTTAVTYRTTYFNTPYTDRTVTGSVLRVSNLEYWQISRTSGSVDATIELMWDDDSQADANFADLVVAYYDGADWATAGGNSHTGNATTGNLQSNANWSTWGQELFTFGTTTASNPLPVELISFDAVKNESIVDLSWVTASEINSDYFSVQKSTDGINFNEIANIKAAGNSEQTLHYDTHDMTPNMGINYYKLVNYDFDGSFETSEIKVINFGTGSTPLSQINLYPNPAQDISNISFVNEEDKIYDLKIFNSVGSVVFDGRVLSPIGKNNFIIDVTTFSPGQYYIHITDENMKRVILPLSKIK